MMKHIISSLALAGLLLGAAPVATPAAAEGAKTKPLRGVVHPRRGGYSYFYLQGVNTKKFVEVPRQSNGGPFDSGFFFSTPGPRNTSDAPYMQ